MVDLAVGMPLNTVAEFDLLPVGTTIGPKDGSTFVKHADGGWYNENGAGPYNIGEDFSLAGYNKVKSLPSTTPFYESLMQWQFRYRDNCFRSADAAGVSRRTVLDAMAELGIGDDYFPLGRGVRLGNEYDKERLPQGTLLQRGEPDNLDSYGLFVKRPSGWLHLLGNVRDHANHSALIVNGDPVEWANRPGTEAEQEALANFKAKAWRVGWKVKLSHRWCESYESYMGRIGLTEDALRGATYAGISTGEWVAPELVSGLPAGSVLRWVSRVNPASFTWYIRDDDMNNAARTRALFGHRADGTAPRNSAGRMQVMWIANEDGPMDLAIDNLADIWNHLPAGTLIRTGGSELKIMSDHLINYRDRRTEEPGQWRLDQFVDVRITGFPS